MTEQVNSPRELVVKEVMIISITILTVNQRMEPGEDQDLVLQIGQEVERAARVEGTLASLARVVASLVKVVDQVLVVGNHQEVDHTHLDLDGQDLDQVVVTTVRVHTTVYPRIGIRLVRILQVRTLGMLLPSHHPRIMDGSLHTVRMEVDGVGPTLLLPPLMMMIGDPAVEVASLARPGVEEILGRDKGYVERSAGPDCIKQRGLAARSIILCRFVCVDLDVAI